MGGGMSTYRTQPLSSVSTDDILDLDILERFVFIHSLWFLVCHDYYSHVTLPRYTPEFYYNIFTRLVCGTTLELHLPYKNIYEPPWAVLDMALF